MRYREQTPAATGGAPLLDIRLFGPMEVRICGQPLPRLRSRKGLWLLALLALRRGAPVDRDWLAGTLWPDDDPEDARRSLRQSLHDLRRALGAAAERLESSGRHTVNLDLTGARLDVTAFDSAALSEVPTELESAVALRTGVLLEGCAEEWVVQEREARDRAFLVALERLAACAQGREDYAAEAVWLRRAVAEEPLREDLWRRLIAALHAAGDSTEALAAYRACRDRLWSELAVHPDAETMALYRSIRDQLRNRASAPFTKAQPAAIAYRDERPRAALPIPLTPLVGRESAVNEIRDLLREARLVTVVGPGGIGKTRLSLEAARCALEVFPDGVSFVDLVDRTDPESVADAVRLGVGVSEGTHVSGGLSELVEFLDDRSALVVLDNCEHVVDACAGIVALLLSTCPDLRVLATSRRPLSVRGEAIYRVQPLDCPPSPAGSHRSDRPEPKQEPLSYPAVRLFAERAHASDKTFRLDMRNSEAVAEICRRLDGIPLAIELAAARTRSLPVTLIRDRLADDLGLLTGLGSANPTRQQTVEAAFEWSWKLLTLAEQMLLRRLAVFAAGWTVTGAEEVCAGDGLDRAQIAVLLGSLVDSSIVVFASGSPVPECAGYIDGAERYYMLETIRQFASHRLEAAGEAEAMRRRHRDYFLRFAESVRGDMVPTNQASRFASLELEHDNLRAALDWTAATGETEALLRLTLALCTFWDTRGYLREGRARLDAALTAATGEKPAELYSRALGYAGWIAYVQGDPSARVYLREALDAPKTSAQDFDIPVFLNMAALAEGLAGDFDEARNLFNQALVLSLELDPPGPVGAILDNLGCLELQLGNVEVAREHIEQCIAWCARTGAAAQMHGIALFDLAVVDLRQGQTEKATRHGVESLRRLHDCGSAVREPDAVSVLALAACAQSDWGRGARLFGAAHELRARVEAPASKLIAHEIETAMEQTRRAMGDMMFDDAFEDGRDWTVDDVLAAVDSHETPSLTSNLDPTAKGA